MGKTKVGFVGVGDQGGPMARNLVKNGFGLIVRDLRDAALEPFRQSGVEIADSLVQLATQSDAVAVCVLNDGHVRSVVFGDDGLLPAMRSGQLLILHSTVAPDLAIEIAKAAAAKGIDFVDAPVSGSRQAREEGRLTVFCGAEPEAFARARPILDAVGDGIKLLGGPGAGQVCKLCNNLMLYCNTLAAFEAARLAEAYGLAETTMVEMTSRSTGGSYVLQQWGSTDRLMEEHPLAGDEAALFAFLEKDLHLAAEAGGARELQLPMTVSAIAAMNAALSERKALNRRRRTTASPTA